MTYISITEQESNHNHLEQKSVHEILTGINREDQTVALAVEDHPDIERLVTASWNGCAAAVASLSGCRTSGRLECSMHQRYPTFGIPAVT